MLMFFQLLEYVLRDRTHVLGCLATPLVNLPVFITFVWSIRGMLRDATVPGLDTGEAGAVSPVLCCSSPVCISHS